MAVDILFSTSKSQERSTFPSQIRPHGDLLQSLLSTLGVGSQYWSDHWLQDHDTIHNSIQDGGDKGVYSNKIENAHAIKTEADCDNQVQVKTETCRCDVCSRLFVGACNLLQFDENSRSITSVFMDTSCYPEEKVNFSNTAPVMSDENLSLSTCTYCGNELLEDDDIINLSKEFSLLSHNMHGKFCLTCLTNNAATSIYEKCDKLDDVTPGIEYECPVCMAVFQSKAEIFKHMETHDRVKNHTCPFCEEQYSDGKEFYSHFITHEKEQEFTCRLCEKVFTRESEYRSHVKSHTVMGNSSKADEKAGAGDVGKHRSASKIADATTLQTKDINLISENDISAKLQCGDDNGTDIHCRDLEVSVDDWLQQNCDSNMAADDLTAVIKGCEISDVSSSQKSAQDIHSSFVRELGIEENCFKQDHLTGSVERSNASVVFLVGDNTEMDNIGKNQVEEVETGRKEPEVIEKNNHIEATSDDQEGSESDCTGTNSDGKHGTDSEQMADISEDKKVDDSLSVMCDEDDEGGNIQTKHRNDSIGFQQRELKTSDKEQSTSKVPNLNDMDESQDILSGDNSVVENVRPSGNCIAENVSKKHVRTEQQLKNKVFDLSLKTYSIDKSKKLHIRKTLVLPKVQLDYVKKKQTDDNNNELLREDTGSKSKHQASTIVAKAKKLSFDKNNNLSSKDQKKRCITYETTISSKIPGGKDHNGSKALVSNFLRAEESLDCIPQSLKYSQRKRKLHSSIRESGNLSGEGRLHKEDMFPNYNDRGVSNGSQIEWISDEKEEVSSDNASSEETVHSSDCNVGGSMNPKEISGHSNSTTKSFKCKRCLKTFRSGYQLSRHMLTHEKSGPHKPFICDICGKNWESRGDLMKHLSVHTGDRPFHCDICQKSFTQKPNLTRHMSTHQEKDGNSNITKLFKDRFRCDICAKSFTQKTHLDRHVRLHTGEKPYKCSTCSERFFESHHLKRHLLKHENGKIMKCAVCDKTYTNRIEYSRHLRTHNQFKTYRLYTCNICNRGYDTRNGLMEHMYIHTGEKPFNCSVCGKSFRQKSEFNKHRKRMKH